MEKYNDTVVIDENTYIEEYLPEDSIMDFKAYKWEPSDNDIKGVLVMANEELGNNKLKDVMKRLLTQVE